MIRQNRNIKGYVAFDTENIIEQFADDTSLLLDGSKDSFEYCVFTILEYAKFSGLSMNFDKTKVVWFGCEHPNNTVYLPELNFEWNPKSFKILGITFTTDLKNISDINILQKMNSMIFELNLWRKRDLTPFGKVTVIKTLVISKIVHILISLPSPSPKILNELNKLFYDFLWDGKPDKIKRSVSKTKINKGGIGVIDVHIFDKALKLTWVRRYFNSHASWKLLFDKMYPNFKEMFNYGDGYEPIITNEVIHPFWSSVVNYYYQLHKNFEFCSKQEVEATRFLFNSNIKIGKKVIKNKKLATSNIFSISQLRSNDTFLTLNELNRKLDRPLNFLEYNSIISVLKKYLNNYSQLKPYKEVIHTPALNHIMSKEKGSSDIYQKFIVFKKEITGFQRWSKITDFSNEAWLASFQLLKNTTSDTKLRWLQYRILHYI